MNLLKQLRATSSKIDKVALLRCATNLELKVFNYAYDYNKVYHIKEVGGVNWNYLGKPTAGLFNFLDSLLSGHWAGYEAKRQVQLYAEEHGDLVKLIVKRDLDCGAAATTVNSAKPNTIPVFKIQLAKEVLLSKVVFPCLAQIKYDGVRIMIVNRTDTGVTFYTRNGKTVLLPSIAKQIEKFKLSPFVLDSEVTLKDGKMEDRTSVSGMINSAIHGGAIDEAKLVFNVFDALTIEEFDTVTCYRPYKNRLEHHFFILESMKNDQIIPAFTMPVDNEEHVTMFYEQLINEGYEGIILKSDSHKYSFKRSKDWVKMKETKTADLYCDAVVGGTGKYEGMIGALSCSGEVEGKQVSVNVGSGLTDTQRDWGQEVFLYETIEVKYNAVIQDSKTGQYSLFLPRFVMVRIDK